MWKRIGGRTRFRRTSNSVKAFTAKARRSFAKWSAKSPARLRLANTFLVTPAARLQSAKTAAAPSAISHFSMARLSWPNRKSRSEHTAWFRGASEWRTRIFIRSNRAAIDRCAGARPLLQRSAAAAKIENGAGKDRRQRLDWNERGDSEGRDHWRQLLRRRWRGGNEKHSSEHNRSGESGCCCENILKRKRIVVMGFMGSMPIAGVIWQHVHYVVGLQRLGHDVFYIEDSARLPYNPKTFEVNDEFDYAAKVLDRLAGEFDFKNRWAFCARYLKNNPTAGLPLKIIRRLYRDADAILNICGTQEFNEDLLKSDRIIYVESDPGVEQIKIDQGVKPTIDYLSRHHTLFTFGENVGTKKFPVPGHGFKWHATRQPIV